MGIRPLRLFDPNKDRSFESWLNRIELHFEVTNCPAEHKTGVTSIITRRLMFRGGEAPRFQVDD